MYESGVLLAFLMWIFGAINSIISINSRMERNLNKIGMRRSWMDGSIKPMSIKDLERSTFACVARFLLLWGLSLPFIALSWLQVAFAIGLVIYRKNKDSGAPQSVREFRWRLRNMDMSFDQIITDMHKSIQPSPIDLDEFRRATIQEMRDRGLTVW